MKVSKITGADGTVYELPKSNVESVVDLTQPQTLTNEQKTTARTNIDAAKAEHAHEMSDLSGTLPTSKGGTGKSGFESVMGTIPTSNPISSTADDTVVTWQSMGNCVSFFNQMVLQNQPLQYLMVMSFVVGYEIAQIGIIYDHFYFRYGNHSGWLSHWKELT